MIFDSMLLNHISGVFLSTEETSMIHPHKFTVVSLFSGAMGLDIGMKKTKRFRLLTCIEKEKAFCETIRRNVSEGRLEPDLHIINSDICNVAPAEVMHRLGLAPGELDVLIGGPPCQSFSTAGKRGTVMDHRGTLLWKFLHFIEILQPKFFVIENVRGLLSAALRHRKITDRPGNGGAELEKDEMPGSVVRSFSDDLQKISNAKYHMDCFEVNAVNYGAPQIRERVFFIGNRFNAVTDFPLPTHGYEGESDSRGMLPGIEKRLLHPWRTLRDAIGDLHEENPSVLDFSPRKKAYLAKIPPGSNWRSLPLADQMESMGKAFHAKGGRSGWWRRLTYDLPCPTLVTMPNHASTSLCHPTETRALSLKEYARIQEFPDEWEFCGKPLEQYAQVGNAVPIKLGRIVGELVCNELDKLANRGWQSYEHPREGYRIVYVQSHVRTRKWFKDGKAFVWDDGGKNVDSTYGLPKTHIKITAI